MSSEHFTPDQAVTSADWPEIAPAEYWEDRYGSAGPIWSGRVNRVLADVCAALTPGRALDLGCGEGADAIWLAQHGWTVTGIDIAPAAIARATEAARAAGLTDRQVTFVAADLSTLADREQYDLITASFLHAPVELARTDILRSAANHIVPGGYLLVTSHASLPSSAAQPQQHQTAAGHTGETDHAGHQTQFLTPDEEVRELALDPGEWTVRIAELRPRDATDAQGNTHPIDDSVVLIQRA